MTFEELYHELFHPLLRQALHKRVPYDDALDIVHDAFTFYLGMEGVADPERYLKRTVRNLSASYWRKRGRIVSTEPVLEGRVEPPPHVAQLTAQALLQRVPELEQRALNLKYIAGYKVREVAAHLGVSEKRAEKILRRARRRAAAAAEPIDETERCRVGGAPRSTDTYVTYRAVRAPRSRGGFDILANDPRMTRRNSQERDRRTVRMPSPLLPVAKRVNADPHRPGKLRLRQPDESAKSRNVVTRFEVSEHQPPPHTCGHRSGELLFRQLRNLGHFRSSM
jgi:RNA polymerase sigma factor (sigma-70 family)